ncbi:UNVERIFIED_CONTAM: hypothetical protein HDU68_012127 [Siphonaria sp. JEL0065]|nr:hypothetical protein HDU68_012127 [Siphonaria sp. JEL0065]
MALYQKVVRKKDEMNEYFIILIQMLEPKKENKRRRVESPFEVLRKLSGSAPKHLKQQQHQHLCSSLKPSTLQVVKPKTIQSQSQSIENNQSNQDLPPFNPRSPFAVSHRGNKPANVIYQAQTPPSSTRKPVLGLKRTHNSANTIPAVSDVPVAAAVTDIENIDDTENNDLTNTIQTLHEKLKHTLEQNASLISAKKAADEALMRKEDAFLFLQRTTEKNSIDQKIFDWNHVKAETVRRMEEAEELASVLVVKDGRTIVEKVESVFYKRYGSLEYNHKFPRAKELKARLDGGLSRQNLRFEK